MSRWIDADALIEAHAYASNDWDRAKQKFALLVVAVNDIKDMPSIDIVRCKECKWGKPYSDKQLKCDALGLGGLKFSDDFCSYGERE